MIEIEDRGEVLSVPVAAVRRVRDVTRVRVRAASGRRVEREVRLGQSDGTYYEVLSGLDDGDRVIVGP